MELTPLRYFLVIAKEGHLTRAARELGVTQPALSAVVRKLEDEVGAALLHRSGRGVELTEAGRVFVQHAEQTLRAAEGAVQAVREVTGLQRGSIRIGGGATATTYLLPPVVSAVRRAYPGLRFSIREAGSSQVAMRVASGELDLGIVTLPVPREAAGELRAVPLVEDELRLIVPDGHRLRSIGSRKGAKSGPAGTFRWSDLEGESVIAFEAGSAVRAMVDQAAGAAGVSLDVVMELRSIEGIKHMVAAGIGLGLVSRFALEEGEGLSCAGRPLSRKLAIVRSCNRPTSAAAQAFERAMLDAWAG